MEFNDKYVMQMCRRETNGFVELVASQTMNIDEAWVCKIDVIKEIYKYKVNDYWVVRVSTDLPISPIIFKYDEERKADRLVYELNLLIIGGDIVLMHIERNQKFIDEAQDIDEL